MLENKEEQQKEIVLTTDEIIELGLRLQAVNEILTKLEPTKEIVDMVRKQIRDISSILIFAEDSDSLEYLKKQ